MHYHYGTTPNNVLLKPVRARITVISGAIVIPWGSITVNMEKHPREQVGLGKKSIEKNNAY